MLLTKIRRRLVRMWASRCVRRAGVQLGRDVAFHGMPIVDLGDGGSLTIGDRTSVISDSHMTALAVAHPVVFRVMARGATITIGADVGLSGTSICAAHAITIGDQTMIGADVIIADTDFHPIAPAGRRFEKDPHKIAGSPVTIGRNVFIGARSIVLKGVEIGDDSVIGAGSVVVKSIPRGSIAAGNPCRVIRSIT